MYFLQLKKPLLALCALSLLTIFPHMASAGQCGKASWYALRSKTASGEMMNPSAMTAAHKTLPLGSKLRVTNKNNGKSIVVRINDRGPFIRGRVLDLSKGAANQLGFIKSGHTNVCYERLS